MAMTYEQQVTHRAQLLKAGRAKLANCADEPDATIGRVIEDSENTRQMLYSVAGDDCEVMVLVAWTRRTLRPEYAEDLVTA